MKKRIVLLLYALISMIPLQGQATVQPEVLKNPAFNLLSKEQYLDTMDYTMLTLFSQGQYLPKDTLIQCLQRYKAYAWGDEKFGNKKPAYFIHLADNARMQNRMGEAIFFYEKADKELELQSRKKSGQVLMQQCYLYTQNKNFKKAVETYEKELLWIESLPDEIRKGTIDEKDILLSLYILSPVASAYIFLNDTLNTEKTINIANDILESAVKNKAVSKTDRAIMQFLYDGMFYFENRHLLNNEEAAHIALNKVSALVNDTLLPEQWRAIIDFNLTDWRIDYFTHYDNADSALYYLEKFKKMPGMMSSEQEFQLRIKGYELKIWSIRTNNSAITKLVDEMLGAKDTMNMALNEQLSDMLYAYTKAEYTSEELVKAKVSEKRKNLIILVAVLTILLAAAVIYIRVRNRQRKAMAQINVMNSLINLKVAEMEEARSQAVNDERERLSRELHDDFSATIAGLRQQTEILKGQTENVRLQERIAEIESGLNYVYKASRTKSHQWYNDSLLQQQLSFKETITFLVNSALPDEQYKKDIQVEADVGRYLSIEDRINILRIIQEAVTNIIKHSKANEVSVFLSDADEEIILQIGDNGVGINMNNKNASANGMGMQSIDKRVKEMQGYWEVINDEGTLISIRVPK